jgi:hypothetical protein
MAGPLSELSDEAQQYAEREQWGQYRNVRYDTAEYVRQEGQWKRAGFLYVEILIFDLQGVTSAPGGEAFHEAYQSPTPSVVREVARVVLRAKMDEGELRTVYDRVADQTWMKAFPRSKADVWEELFSLVMEQRDAVLLEKKVETLGRDQLLSEAEFERYVECKDSYEVLRRVEQILENEHPERIPKAKRDRARAYLAAVEPDDLGNRWKAKAYRRAGEVMLSSNGQKGKKKALEYFERALEAADRDEVAAVKSHVKRLRRELER